MTLASFNKLAKGDQIDYCMEGGFTVQSVSRDEDGNVTHVKAKHTSPERGTITLTPADADETELSN